MSENQENQKPNLLKKILLWPFKSPISAICLAGILYFGFKAYILQADPDLNKLIVLAFIAAWIILFILKHLIILLLLIILAGGIFYAYYQYTNRPRIECEEKGGIWNDESKTCEEKTGLMAEVQKVINKYKKYIYLTNQ